ncbi:LipA and NB-ARC domain protein [Aspergillus saccharolyticus JOP 1030-1]|uniref:Lipa and NB-ARC domain protein n=1 Tax=Aspergillus saccharolyticus JOP 1030-1 TaxID=1450539 RepID=A0A318ZP18_9EURO|nr:lipa and NB-ARC domain protein [Aspergillus saccharolyticus JOP 1030-1]PYH49339.1 lipa and NB-ARC domain protein [Aspergillus saccharolyticus JOP 1030-1]
MEDTSGHEFPFLEEVFTPQGPPKIDFVFVHGLNPRGRADHPYETWTHQNGTFWPRDYLPQDIPQARVFVYGYNSNITNPQSMSTASVKDHANTLLNLLDLERNPQMNVRPPKIIFVGHSLGGLVIKQALLNAHEDPKYNAIRNNTYGLVFFGCPHRGTKGVELGKIAAKVARFVANGHASNDLLDSLEHNSLFTRQMTSRFSHQLEDYRVISFVEGKEVLLGGVGPASVSHLVVDEESAVLGLPGQRETRLKLDADHSQMCKVGARGAMYKMIKGNIKQIADQVLVVEQRYIPQPSTTSTAPHPAPPVPSRLPLNSSMPYPSPQSPPPVPKRVVGALFTAVDNDPRSIQAAEHKNHWRWDEARKLEYAIFQEHLRVLGADHHSTLEVGYHLAEIDLESSYYTKAAEWAQWVSSNAQRVFGLKHPLAMRAESLMGEILANQGRGQEAESVCANVLARQQMTIGEDALETLRTRRRLAIAYGVLERRQEAVQAAERVTDRLREILGPTHIRTFASVLDTAEQMVALRSNNTTELITMRFNPAVDQMVQVFAAVSREMTELLGPRHPLTIKSVRLLGASQMLEPEGTSAASETFRRALAAAEEYLGHEHPETLAVVALMGVMYASQGRIGVGTFVGAHRSHIELATPWLLRYLAWCEVRMGADNVEAQSVLDLLAKLYFEAQDYVQAQGYYERLEASYRLADKPMPEAAANWLRLCRMNTRYLMPKKQPGLQSLLQPFQRM